MSVNPVLAAAPIHQTAMVVGTDMQLLLDQLDPLLGSTGCIRSANETDKLVM